MPSRIAGNVHESVIPGFLPDCCVNIGCPPLKLLELIVMSSQLFRATYDARRQCFALAMMPGVSLDGH